jgi:citrate lyase subunit beta/citryl-CoA lyase
MFVPGNVNRFLDKVPLTAADAVIYDLEDGVLPAFKEEARIMVSRALATKSDRGPLRLARVNAADTQWHNADVAAMVSAGVDGICLPKADHPNSVARFSGRIDRLEREYGKEQGSIAIIATIESAASLLSAREVAGASERVIALMLGAEDLALDVGLSTHRVGAATQLLFARSMVAMASAAERVLSIDCVYPDLEDNDGLLADAMYARELGFSSKSTFHPCQVAAINEVFGSSPSELEYAIKVVEAFENAQRRGEASVTVDGRLVDRPIVLRARKVLAQAVRPTGREGT